MPLLGRLIRLAASPQGRKLIGQAQKAVLDPKNRQRPEQSPPPKQSPPAKSERA